MTKSCVVCKKYPVSGDNTRSFHKFPIDKDIKQQWMDITGITKVTINCTVCSDHFTPQSYHQTDGFGSVKRLLSNAVPIVDDNDTDEIEEIEETNEDEIENIMLEESERESSKKVKRQSVCRTRLSKAKENHISTPLDNFDDQSCSNDSSSQSIDEKISNLHNMSGKLKRKLSTTNIRALDIKRMFRFRDGGETKFICREEFVTEDAWNKFLRLMLLNRRRLEGLRQRICRRKKMIDSGQSDDGKKEECDPEKFLEVVLKE